MLKIFFPVARCTAHIVLILSQTCVGNVPILTYLGLLNATFSFLFHFKFEIVFYQSLM